ISELCRCTVQRVANRLAEQRRETAAVHVRQHHWFLANDRGLHVPSSDPKDDLAEVLTAFDSCVRGRGLGKRQDAVDDGTEALPIHLNHPPEIFGGPHRGAADVDLLPEETLS